MVMHTERVIVHKCRMNTAKVLQKIEIQDKTDDPTTEPFNALPMEQQINMYLAKPNDKHWHHS